MQLLTIIFSLDVGAEMSCYSWSQFPPFHFLKKKLGCFIKFNYFCTVAVICGFAPVNTVA